MYTPIATKGYNYIIMLYNTINTIYIHARVIFNFFTIEDLY